MSARLKVTIWPLDNGRFAAVCETGTCSWTGTAHVVKAAAEDEARIHRQTHRAKPAPKPKRVDDDFDYDTGWHHHGGPAVRTPAVRPPEPVACGLPASVVARCADTTGTPGQLTVEPVWLRCDCGAWVTGVSGDTAAEVREEAEEIGWERIDGEGPWRCPRCALAADQARRAVA